MADQDFQIKISTTAELRALRDLESTLQRQVVQAKALGKDYRDVASQLAAVQGQLGQKGLLSKMLSELGGMAEKVPVLGEGMRALNGAAGAASGGLAAASVALAGLAKSVQEFAQAERAIARLDAALAQTGQLSDANREKFQGLAAQLQESTGIADETWASVLARLVQFGAKTADIDRHAAAVKNLAGIMGGDLESSAMMVARAMQGNYTALARLGIKVDEHLPQAEKLNQLYIQLANRGGGQLEAMSQTISGRFATLKNNVSDLFEAFGRATAATGILQGAIHLISDAAAYWGKVLGGMVPVVGGLTNAIEETTISIDDQAAAVSKVKTAYDEALKALDNYLVKQREEMDFQKQMIDLEKERQLALLEQERQARSGGATPMSESEYASRRAGITAGSAEAIQQLELAGIDMETGARKSRLSALDTDRHQIDKRLGELSAARKNATRAAMNKASVARWSKELEEAKKAYEEATASGASRAWAPGGQELEAAKQRIADAEAGLGRAQAKWGGASSSTSEIDAEERLLRERRAQNATQSNALQDELGGLESRRRRSESIYGAKQSISGIRASTEGLAASHADAKTRRKIEEDARRDMQGRANSQLRGIQDRWSNAPNQATQAQQQVADSVNAFTEAVISGQNRIAQLFERGRAELEKANSRLATRP